MNTKQDFEEIIRQAQEGIKRLEEPEFKKGDWVEVSDSNEKWFLRKFSGQRSKAGFSFSAENESSGHEVPWTYCRQPQLPNILIRHTTDEMPAWILSKNVTTFWSDGEETITNNDPQQYGWSRKAKGAHITHFLVHDE